MDFHLKGFAIGIVFLILQLVFYKKIKNKVIRLIPLLVALLCFFFYFLLFLAVPPIETTLISSNEFTGLLGMVWCSYGILGTLLGVLLSRIQKSKNGE